METVEKLKFNHHRRRFLFELVKSSNRIESIEASINHLQQRATKDTRKKGLPSGDYGDPCSKWEYSHADQETANEAEAKV